MKYVELLKIAQEKQISVVKLNIAYSLECCLNKELNEEEFENLCEKTYDIYLSLDTYNLDLICQIVLDTILLEEEKEILEIDYEGDLEEYVHKTFYLKNMECY